jgi:hypothetical protein
MTTPADLETRLRTHLTTKASLAPIDDVATRPWLAATLAAPPVSGDSMVTLLDEYVPTESRRPTRRYRAFAIAAAVLIAAGILAVGQGSARTRTNNTNWNPWPVLIPSFVPPGLRPGNAQLLGGQNFDSPARLLVFRDGDTPTGTRTIVVRINKQQFVPEGTTINGRVVAVSSPSSVQTAFPNGIVVQLIGLGLAPDELRDLALRARPVSDNPLDGVDLAPAGLKLVADQRLEQASSTTAMSNWSDDSGLRAIELYQRPAGPAEMIESDVAATDTDVPQTELTIGGRPARLFTDTSDDVPLAQRPALELIWSTSAGTLVQVHSSGIAESALRQVAESLHVAGQDEWSRLSGASTEVAATTAAVATTAAPALVSTVPRRSEVTSGFDVHFAPTSLSAGYKIDLADDTYVANVQPVEADRTTIYRDADPLGHRLLFVLSGGGLGGDTHPAEPRDTDLFGQTGRASASSIGRSDIGPDRAWVTLSGPGLTDHELESILDSVVLPSPPWSGPAAIAVPAGMVMISDRGARPVGPEALMMLSAPQQPGHRINIRARPTVTGELQEEMVLQPTAVATTVRGHAGYTLQLPTRDATFLVWQETPDVRVQIAGRSVSIDTLMHLANGLKPVTPAAWVSLAPAAALPPTSTTRP